MKKHIKKALRLFLYYFSYLYSYNIFLCLNKFKSIIYTFWLSREFKFLGENSIIGMQLTLKGAKYISIGEKTGIGKRAVLTAWDKQGNNQFFPEIIIGNKVSIGEDCHITAINRIVIRNNVLMGKKITISDNSHGTTDAEMLLIPPTQRIWFSKGPVIIGNNVWIGDKATILSGVTIGDNAVIGANSVVTANIPPNCVAVGVPAKVLNRRGINENL